MSYDHEKQQLKNFKALTDPQPGDYWQEMFCPYFVVVKVKGDAITVLSCLKHKDEPYAKVENRDGTWSFDYSQSMVVDRAWIERKVKYQSIDGFVADVWQSEKTQRIVAEWRDYVQKEMRKKIAQMESEWEEFTGWKYLKEEIE